MVKRIFRVAVMHTIQITAKADTREFISIHPETYILIFFQAVNMHGVRKRLIFNSI